MLKTKPIRDPVFDYIELTPIEQLIIDRPEFQRLRFVSQNSTAYMTYPNNVHTRFLHSLGVMHLGGQIFCRSLQNASAEDLKRFLATAAALIDQHQAKIQAEPETIKAGWNKSLGDAARFNHRPLVGERLSVEGDDIFFINVLWQVIRVVGLVHDIGTLPMSHVFEFAIEEVISNSTPEDMFAADIRKRKTDYIQRLAADGIVGADAAFEWPIHELFGQIVFTKIYPEDKTDNEVDAFQKLVSSIAKRLFAIKPNSQAETDAILECLHTIVAGPLDADRLDYCIRDARQSGLELGAFDLRRILDSMLLVENNGRFHIVPTTKSLSAIEAFFHQRFLLYRHLIYHHNVVRMDGILKEILIRLFRTAASGNPQEIKQILTNFGLWSDDENKYKFLPSFRFSHYDDTWLRSLMTEVYYLLERKRRNKGLSSSESELLLMLDTLLHRRINNIGSLWKRDSDYYRDFNNIFQELGTPLDSQNEILVKLSQTSGTGIDFKKRLPKLRSELEAKGVTLIYRNLKRKILEYTPDSEDNFKIWDEERLVDIHMISPYLEGLKDVSEKVPTLHFSFLAEGIKSNQTMLNDCKALALNNLRDYIRQGDGPSVH